MIASNEQTIIAAKDYRNDVVIRIYQERQTPSEPLYFLKIKSSYLYKMSVVYYMDCNVHATMS